VSRAKCFAMLGRLPPIHLLEVDASGGVNVVVVIPMPRMPRMVWVGVVGVVVVVLAAGDGGQHKAAFAPKHRVFQAAQLMYAAARVHGRVEPAQRARGRSIVHRVKVSGAQGSTSVVRGVVRGAGRGAGRGVGRGEGTARGRGRSP